MKAILPTILIIIIGILAGCSTPSAIIMATGSQNSPLPAGSKVHVVMQSSPESNPSTLAIGLSGPEIQAVTAQQTLSDAVALQLAEKGYNIVPSIEAEYWVTAYLSRYTSASTTKAQPILLDTETTAKGVTPVWSVGRSYSATPIKDPTGLDGRGIHQSPPKQESNAYLDRPDMTMEPDDQLTLHIEIIQVPRSPDQQPAIIWTGKLITKYETDPQRYVRTLLNYFGQDFHNNALLALK